MTHIGYAKPQMFFNHPRGPRHDNQTITFQKLMLSSYRLQLTSRFSGISHQRGELISPRVSFLLAPLPLQRASKFPTLPLPIHRFLQPLNRSSVTPFVTCEFIPPRWHSKDFAYKVCLPNDIKLSSSYLTPSLLPASYDFHPVTTCVPDTLPLGFPFPVTRFLQAPCFLVIKSRLSFQAWANLEVLIPFSRVSWARGSFTQHVWTQLSWLSHLQGLSLTPWFPCPF